MGGKKGPRKKGPLKECCETFKTFNNENHDRERKHVCVHSSESAMATAGHSAGHHQRRRLYQESVVSSVAVAHLQHTRVAGTRPQLYRCWTFLVVICNQLFRLWTTGGRQGADALKQAHSQR